MTGERTGGGDRGPPWPEVEGVLDALLDRNPRSWPRVLNDACHGDRRLRRSVESLLARRERITTFMERPLVPDFRRLLELAAAEDRPLEGRLVGPYRLVREIGRGGMGSVWLATRETRRGEQRVAVKILHDYLTGGEIEQRFALERRVLASLAHPNIARLVDGGVTDDGRLCLIMEYLEGRPIDVFCAERGLGLRDRVALFLVVVRALRHAHAHGVVHRDIKPSNILVTDAGEVKLVDFGIAKPFGASAEALGPNSSGGHSRPMTPRYAAPEQLRGDQITPRTDIYQLGVVLSELLAEFPREPRPLQRCVNGILFTALRRDPAERYSSAAALADDVERFLAGRTLKLAARRRRLPFAGGVLGRIARAVRLLLGSRR
jgi:serine/threonine-protein kinase